MDSGSRAMRWSSEKGWQEKGPSHTTVLNRAGCRRLSMAARSSSGTSLMEARPCTRQCVLNLLGLVCTKGFTSPRVGKWEEGQGVHL